VRAVGRAAGMAGKWEMQVQNVNKRAPEGLLLYIYIQTYPLCDGD